MKNKWFFRTNRKGSTLVEVLVSFGILATTGVFVSGFLYKNPTTNKAWTDNYGQELSKIVLLTVPAQNDTIIEHNDENGVAWETILKFNRDNEETCISAVSVRLKHDTTRTLHFCKYGEKYDIP